MAMKQPQFMKCECTKEGYGITPIEAWEYEILLYSWGLGRGKTEVAKRFIDKNPDKRVLILTPRVMLCHNARIRFNKNKEPDNPSWIEDYQNKDVANRETCSLVTCLPSLEKAIGQFDVVIVDEVESVISMFNAPEIMNGRSSQHTFNLLIKLLRSAEKVFLLDAHLGNSTKSLLTQAGLIERSVLLDCPGEERTWIEMPSRIHHLHFMAQQVNQGKKIAIATMSHFHALTLERFLRKHCRGKEIHCITGKRSYEKELIKEDTTAKELFECDVFIYTQVIDSGVSIEFKDDSGGQFKHYDQVHICLWDVGDGNNVRQMSARVRHPKNTDIYFSGDFREIPDLVEAPDLKERLKSMWQSKENNLEDIFKKESINFPVPKNEWFFNDSFIEVLSTTMAESIKLGRGWILIWVRNNLATDFDNLTKEQQQILEELNHKDLATLQEEFAAELQAIKWHRSEAISRLDYTEELLEEVKASVVENPSDELAWKQLLVLSEYQQLYDFFGDAYHLAEFTDKNTFTYENTSGLLAKRTQNFGATYIMCTSKCYEPLFYLDSLELLKYVPEHRSSHAAVGYLCASILHAMAFEWDAIKSFYTTEEILPAFEKAEKFIPQLEMFGITPPMYRNNSPQCLRWFHYFMGFLGIKTKKSRKTINGQRVQVQKVLLGSIEKMFLLSQKIRGIWTSTDLLKETQSNIQDLLRGLDEAETEYTEIVGGCFEQILSDKTIPQPPLSYEYHQQLTLSLER